MATKKSQKFVKKIIKDDNGDTHVILNKGWCFNGLHGDHDHFYDTPAEASFGIEVTVEECGCRRCLEKEIR
jgi:hypothetical protein